MQVIIQPIGKSTPENPLNEACKALNIIQTIWRFDLKLPIPRKFEGTNVFNHDAAFSEISEVRKFSFEGDESTLLIGTYQGRVDTNDLLCIYEEEIRNAIISDYWWPTFCSHIYLWILALINVSLRHYIHYNCSNEYCLGYHSIPIDKLEVFLSRVTLCENCREKFEDVEPYRADEIKLVADWLNKYWASDFKIEDLVTIDIPKLKVFQTQIRRQQLNGRSNLFEPYHFILILHYLPDLIPFLEGLMSLGAKQEKIALLVKPYPYAGKAQVGGYLTYKYPNLKIDYLSSLPPTANQIQEVLKVDQGTKFIIIEDGGYLVPFIHNNVPNYDKFCRGAVEQTTKGIRNDEALREPKIPILNVAKSKFKDDYEAPLVGKSIVYNIERLLEKKGFHFPGTKAAVVGFGPIGKAVAEALRKTLDMIVHVAEPRSDLHIKAKNLGFIVSESAEEAIKDSFLIVGTTGGTRTSEGVFPTIGRKEFKALQDRAVLVSASSDQIEYDVKELNAIADNKKYLYGIGTEYLINRSHDRQAKFLLIGDGYPINFYRGQGIPDESIDPILTQLLLGAIEIATKNLPTGIVNNLIDDVIEKSGMLDDFLNIHH